MKAGLVIVFGVALAACSHGHCRVKSNSAEPPKVDDAPPVAEPPAKAKAGSEWVQIYKYDGSLQCQQGKAISLDAMAKELTGIPIRSSRKKHDGLMHIQVCGSITGQANVYEIPEKHLKQAEAKGFKKWSFE